MITVVNRPRVRNGRLPMRLSVFTVLLALAGGVMGLVVAGVEKEKPDAAAKTKAGTPPKAEPKGFAGRKGEKEAEAAVIQSAESFLAAYNPHAAKTQSAR